MLVSFFGLVAPGTRENTEFDRFADEAGIMLVETTTLPPELPVHLDGVVVGSAEYAGLKTQWVGFNPQTIDVAMYNVRIHTPEHMALLDQSNPGDQLFPVTVVSHGSDGYPSLTCVFGIDLIRLEELDGESLV